MLLSVTKIKKSYHFPNRRNVLAALAGQRAVSVAVTSDFGTGNVASVVQHLVIAIRPRKFVYCQATRKLTPLRFSIRTTHAVRTGNSPSLICNDRGEYEN